MRWPAPLLLHAGIGAAALVWLASQPACGSDECLRNLFLGVLGVVWLLGAAWIALSARSVPRILTWAIPFVWLPVGWLAALALWLLFPSLGY